MDLEQVEAMQKLLEQKKKELEKEKEGEKVLGFTLRKCKGSESGKKYWRAYRRHKGKTHVVYIGASITKANEKIMEYIFKHELNELLPPRKK
jgi:hypothetical protein